MLIKKTTMERIINVESIEIRMDSIEAHEFRNSLSVFLDSVKGNETERGRIEDFIVRLDTFLYPIKSLEKNCEIEI